MYSVIFDHFFFGKTAYYRAGLGHQKCVAGWATQNPWPVCLIFDPALPFRGSRFGIEGSRFGNKF